MWFKKNEKTDPRYAKVIADTAAMVRERPVRKLVKKYGLDIVDVTWEDTGRFKGSAVGPNISDLTIQVEEKSGPRGPRLTCMPVIRFPNFSDRSADVSIDKFSVLVGNECGEKVRPVGLKRYLKNLRRYLTDPRSWDGNEKSLLAKRDEHVLVSAQACFLPVPQRGEAKFNPVLFNYQSTHGAPAVLSILATREGTSATVIDNSRDGFSVGSTWGQRLFFNANGERASLTGERKSDFLESHQGQSMSSAEQEGLNAVMLIQVPLKIPQPRFDDMLCAESCAMPAGPMRMCSDRAKSCDVEAAVIGHGDVEGPFTEIDDLAIERDPRFPIRVTVQFYQATSNGVLSKPALAQIAEQINRVYKDGTYVGSLVTEGHTTRPTEYTPSPSNPSKREPRNWWNTFWKRYERDTGRSREDALSMLFALRGGSWLPDDEGELSRALDEMRD